MTTFLPPSKNFAGPRFGRAVVMGGSIAGLLAARALADHFATVLVVDRDAEPESPGNGRPGTPQDHHTHLLLKGGLDAIEELFPGVCDELEADGVRRLDFARDVAWKQSGAWKARFTSGLQTYSPTRPDLESRIRRRVAELANVRQAWSTGVEELLFDARGRRVIGLVIADPLGERRALWTDLVVDATGVGSKTPARLRRQGLPAPEEETVSIGLAYTSARFRPTRGTDWGWECLCLAPASRSKPRGGMIMPLADGSWSVSLYGYRGDHAPTDLDGFLHYARSLAAPVLADALAEATLTSPIRRFAIPKQVRRRYERLHQMPDGLVVIGDAACRFDPAFGQGMSTAALEARALGNELTRRVGKDDPLRGFSRRFQKLLSRIVDVPWKMSGGGGQGTSLARLERWYRRQLAAAATEPELHRTFLEVMHLVAPPRRLYRPRVVGRLLVSAWRRSKGRSELADSAARARRRRPAEAITQC